MSLKKKEESKKNDLLESSLVLYRSIGVGLFGLVMRYVGMPLEKIALYMNSTQIPSNVRGIQAMQHAFRLTFAQGPLTPYRVVGPASLMAWFFQYSCMGLAFQSIHSSLCRFLDIKPIYYGKELFQPAQPSQQEQQEDNMTTQSKFALACILSPFLAGAVESLVSNRAEVERYFGKTKFNSLETSSLRSRSSSFFFHPIRQMAGPAFTPNMMRNVIMSSTSFVLTPLTFTLYMPQEYKTQTNLFWFGLLQNIFVGNVMAITQQALWGRTLDHYATSASNTIHYRQIITQAYRQEGYRAFITGPKWFSRVLMNCPAQGALPWFYNQILPLGEPQVQTMVYYLQQQQHNILYRETTTPATTAQLTRKTTTTTTRTTSSTPTTTTVTATSLWNQQ